MPGMSLFRILVAALLAFLVSARPADQSSSANPLSSTPRLQRIFRSTAQLGDFNAPIPIPGGQRIVASVTGGTITAEGQQGITGTFKGGISIIDISNDGQSIVNNVQTFGTTSDGTPFLVTESGLGSPADDFARLIFTIGGKFAFLQNQFLITEAVLAADRKSVMTVGYVVLDR
ncbi:MAG: hypothetical protein Q9181_005148 [Wetmoreana brouardii]